MESPVAFGMWVLDRILGNPKRDYVADNLEQAKTGFEAKAKLFAKPAYPRPFPPLLPLADNFVNPSFGEAAVTLEGDALVMEHCRQICAGGVSRGRQVHSGMCL